MARAPLREISLHATESHFFVAAKPPFKPRGKGYKDLDFMALDVRYLDEGSQIFIYDRDGFGDSPERQEDELGEFMYSITKAAGVVLDRTVYPVGSPNGGSRA